MRRRYPSKSARGKFNLSLDNYRLRPYPRPKFALIHPSLPPPYPQPDDPRLSCLGLPLSLPYEVETLAEMDERLELIACRLVECVKAREWGTGFRMWDSALSMSAGFLTPCTTGAEQQL